jgi:hypothetical protein
LKSHIIFLLYDFYRLTVQGLFLFVFSRLNNSRSELHIKQKRFYFCNLRKIALDGVDISNRLFVCWILVELDILHAKTMYNSYKLSEVFRLSKSFYSDSRHFWTLQE